MIEKLDTIYKECYSSVFKSALSVLKNETQAEEITQDTFLAFSNNSSLITNYIYWLQSVARNLAKTKIRSEIRRRDRETEFTYLREDDFTPHYNFDLVEEIMLDLSKQQKVFITEFFINGLSQTEIAIKYSINQCTVSREITKALKFLRNHIKHV